jgi:hypothetical protein
LATEKRPVLSVIAEEKFRPVGLKVFESSATLIDVPLLNGPFCACPVKEVRFTTIGGSSGPVALSQKII